VLHFGCGPGRYRIPAAGLVGQEGTVYAVDKNPDQPALVAQEEEVASVLLTEGLFHALAAEYDAWFESAEGRPLFESEVRCIRQVLPEECRPWLEVGVGTGRFAQALGVDVGIDPAARALSMAAARGIRVVQARGEALPFAPSQFGVVLVVVTLCFAPMPLALMQESTRVLTDEGRVVLGLVLADSPWGRHYARLGETGHRFYSRARFYTMEEVRQLTAQAGLQTAEACCSLFQEPGAAPFVVEDPREGLDPRAGFVAVSFTKAGAEGSRKRRPTGS
jgi:SAM-dependent methyltransferase